MPLLSNSIDIAGIHIEEPKPLPKVRANNITYKIKIF